MISDIAVRDEIGARVRRAAANDVCTVVSDRRESVERGTPAILPSADESLMTGFLVNSGDSGWGEGYAYVNASRGPSFPEPKVSFCPVAT